jgi:hypothetical protein
VTYNPLIVFGVIVLLLALPALFQEPPIVRFGRALLVSAFGVVLPLAVFCLSAFLVPDWKGACRHGWVDCFHLGKLALLPVVLWATGALYAVEVSGVAPRANRSVVLALFSGATLAAVCFLHGLVVVDKRSGTVLFLAVSLYIAVWHGLRAYQFQRVSRCGPWWFIAALLGGVPFWFGAVIWSHEIYYSLPENPPNCFIVTAASRGHAGLVGPFSEVRRNGGTRQANRQLATLWQFEELWRTRAARTHALFRRLYNRLGPVIARQITTPWFADLVFISLKPAELLARLAIAINERKPARQRATLSRNAAATVYRPGKECDQATAGRARVPDVMRPRGKNNG